MTSEALPVYQGCVQPAPRRVILAAGMAAGAALLIGSRCAVAQQAPARTPSGQVSLEQTQVSFIANAGWGRGTLSFRGRNYRFRLHNLGIGGIGITKLSAHGEVYGLTRAADFAGLYGQLRAGAVIADRQLKGGLWLANTAGVQIHLVPNRQGLALNVGADGLVIDFGE